MRTAFSPTENASGAGTILCALSPWTSPPAVCPRRRPSFRPVSPVVRKIRGPDDDRYPASWAGPHVLSPPLTSERATPAAAPGEGRHQGVDRTHRHAGVFGASTGWMLEVNMSR